jgi:molecular chaperone GrpE
MGEDEKTDTPDFHVIDRRFWVENESKIETATIPEVKYPSFIEELKTRTEAAEQKLAEKIQQLDQENAAYRERIDRQLEKRVSQERADFIKSLLEVIDNFERALSAADEASSFEALRDGVRLNLNLLLMKFTAAGVAPIENLNQPFDPSEAEALSVQTVSDPELDNKVVEVVQKGYRLGDQLLRPAVVHVGRYGDKNS